MSSYAAPQDRELQQRLAGQRAAGESERQQQRARAQQDVEQAKQFNRREPAALEHRWLVGRPAPLRLAGLAAPLRR